MKAYMGSYLNPGTGAFQMARNSEIFIDKSRLIEETNRHVNTIQRFLCVSRPRRFGKSMAADMLAAYYDCKKDTSDFRLLSELKRKYPNNVQDDGLTFTMKDVYAETGHFAYVAERCDCKDAGRYYL